MSLCKKEKACIAVNTAPSVNPGNVIQSLEVGSLSGGDMQRLTLLLLVAIASLFGRHPLGQQGAAEAHAGQSSVGRATHALSSLTPQRGGCGRIHRECCLWNTRISENGVSSEVI